MNIQIPIFVASVTIRGYSVEPQMLHKADTDVLSVLSWLEETINETADDWGVTKVEHDYGESIIGGDCESVYHNDFTEDDFGEDNDDDGDDFTLALEDGDTNRIFVKLTKYEL